ncbi:DUF4382 domain-containing protein [Vitiosangium sp. GDMCC 1.1324]|uniref:DUF4382 domain-containing protein n=1 Tax=Vitiosangium sp. (strain GDMCC 1.1324) TaxID=2138576 RepID=UPI000D338514|nr:DUF4382 domain-containing protein [Vitiosangium sp. GDMCC 1.1324]PTL84879.1 hypothetical protein DAT35_07445 [Vitiosangium sp. GDMCC 1.1324]
MKHIQFLALGLFALAFGLVITSCGELGESRVTIKLTDAPGDFKSAVVTISEVYLQGDGGKLVLRDTPVTTNLVTLANDTADLVKDAVVPAGTYKELRFVISGAYIEVEQADGSSLIYATSNDYAGLPAGAKVTGNLQTPSYNSSGLKVKFDGDVEVSGEQKVILVDFDVSQSFGKERGQGDKWVMKPVVKGADITLSGSVTVTLTKDATVTLPTVDGKAVTLADFKATLKSTETSADGASAPAAEEIALTDTNGDGVFEAQFKFLVPGSYEINFTAPAGVSFTTNPAVPAPVSIGSGQEQKQAFTLKSASAL